MALKAGRVGVHPDDVDLNGHIKSNTQDLSAYLKKTDAPGYSDILTQTSASSTYQTQSGMSDYQEKLVSGTNIKTINNQSLLGSGNISIQGGGGDLSAYVLKEEAPGYADILTQTSASSTYLTQSSASSTYLTQSSASSTYQTQSGMSSYVLKSEATGYDDILTSTSAASTYLSQSSASSTYQTQSGMSSYVLKSEATGYNDILTATNAATVYQTILVSGTNIKTINGASILGSGNINTGSLTLLWENSNVTDGVVAGPFDGQKLSFTTTGYTAFLVGASHCDGNRAANICWNYIVNDPNIINQSIKSGGWFNKNNSQIYNTNDCRFVSLIESDGITISNGPQGSGSNYRYYAVPWKIYGIK